MESPPEGRDLPYLSVVATARNDNHGGNLLGRMQIFVDAWINQAKRHNLASELILVEWNPPAGKPNPRDPVPLDRDAAGLWHPSRLPLLCFCSRAGDGSSSELRGWRLFWCRCRLRRCWHFPVG